MWTRRTWRVVEMVSSADLLFWMVPGLSQLFSKYQTRAALQPWTSLIGRHLRFSHAPAYTNTPMSTWQRWGPSPWCLLLVFNLSRTKSFICSAQRRDFHRLRRPTCHWVMKHLLMFLKGHQDEKETQLMLNTKPMVPDTPHPSLSALSKLLMSAIPALNCGTSRLPYGGWMVTAALKR